MLHQKPRRSVPAYYPIDLPLHTREDIEATIEVLIALLDCFDGDPDLDVAIDDQPHDEEPDLEVTCEDEGADADFVAE